MRAKDLINFMIPPLKLTDNVGRAMKWMDEIKLSELPVTDRGGFLGVVTEEILLEQNPNDELQSIELYGVDAIVHEDQHYYEVLKKAYSLGVRIVAVRNDKDEYTGSISIEDVVEAFAHSSSVNTPGAILVLSMEYRDYSLSEISRIVENDDAKILSSQLSGDAQESGHVLVTIKINKEDVTHLSSVLESSGYRIAESFSEKSISDHNQERFDSLMNYLNI